MGEKNEKEYYDEIMDFIKTQIESNFKSSNTLLKVYCKTGELQKGLSEIISENGITSSAIINYASMIPPLDLDIFALITDGTNYELLIIEVKKKGSVGLAHLSQLIGYCIVSNAQYGLLINVDGGESSRFTDLLLNEPDMTYIRRMLAYSTRVVEHNLGVMEWDSVVQSLYYSGYGRIETIPKLCKMLESKFSH